MKKLMCAVMLVVMMFSTAAMGYGDFGEWHGSIRSRINEDYGRIERGVEHGSLTRHEARMLKGELEMILNKIDRMKSDGHLDAREREIINRNLDRLDRDIRREKRNNERRY